MVLPKGISKRICSSRERKPPAVSFLKFRYHAEFLTGAAGLNAEVGSDVGHVTPEESLSEILDRKPGGIAETMYFRPLHLFCVDAGDFLV